MESKFQESCERTTDLLEFLSDFVSTFLRNKNVWQKLVLCITVKKLSSFCIITAKLMGWYKLMSGFLQSDICILTILNISLGCGEHLVRTILARECSCALQTEDAHQALLETMQNKFIGKWNLPKLPKGKLVENSSNSMRDIYSCDFCWSLVLQLASDFILCYIWKMLNYRRIY